MTETLSRIWEELVFYGPAFGSLFILLALGIISFLAWMLVRKLKRDVDKDEKKK